MCDLVHACASAGASSCCPFVPASLPAVLITYLPAPILHQGYEGLTQRIANLQAEKEARAATVRFEEESARLRECTFAPDINRRRVEAKVGYWGTTGVVVVVVVVRG